MQSSFLKRYKILIVLLLVGVLSVSFVVALKRVFPPFFSYVEFLLSNFIQNTENLLVYFRSKEELQAENKALKMEVQKLKLRIDELEYLKLENDVLRRYLSFKTDYGIERFVVGKVIGRSPDMWVNSFRIDVGSGDGVKKGDLVVFDGYLVGLVEMVYQSFSSVLAISDKNFKITVRTKKTGESCLYQGFDEKTGYLKYVKPEQDVRIGDIVIADAVSPNVPAGIPIGVIKSVSQKEGEFFRTVEVSLLYRQNSLNYVMVVSR